MKRLLSLTSALVLILTASTGFAVDETSWGTVKQTLTLTVDEDGRTLFTFSPQATRRAAKLLSDDGRSVSDVFDEDGGDLEIDEEGDPDTDFDDLEIDFEIPEDALDDEVEITMTVYGQMLSDLVIAFEPGGLEFLIDAELEIELGKDRVDIDLDDLEAYHTTQEDYDDDDDNDWEEEECEIENFDETDDEIEFTIAVPGFSRYSTGGGF